MSSGANDQAINVNNLQPYATMVGDMLHCIENDHMFLQPNAFNRPTMTQNKDMNLRFPLIHPQLQFSCAFAKICLVQRWPCPPAS